MFLNVSRKLISTMSKEALFLLYCELIAKVLLSFKHKTVVTTQKNERTKGGISSSD